jgi:hypothetical protein
MTREYNPKQIELAVNTIKTLSIEAVEKANSGHPGTPMGLADISFELFTRYLRYDPKDPGWIGRDRIVHRVEHPERRQHPDHLRRIEPGGGERHVERPAHLAFRLRLGARGRETGTEQQDHHQDHGHECAHGSSLEASDPTRPAACLRRD